MPSRFVNKIDAPDAYYHVFARGLSKQKIFLDSQDHNYFIGLFARYLSDEPRIGKDGAVYPHYNEGLELVAYCLMQNHFHMLIYQIEPGAMKRFMQSAMTSYCRYFNLKYKRSGPLFESRYKAAMIMQNSHLQHITRYIHLNPRFWRTCRYSSIKYFLGDKAPEWLRPERATELFDGVDDYEAFVADYEDNKRMLDELKGELADQKPGNNYHGFTPTEV